MNRTKLARMIKMLRSNPTWTTCLFSKTHVYTIDINDIFELLNNKETKNG